MKIARLAPALVASVLVLGACATAKPTVYRPQATATDVGFAQYRMEEGRYRVTFRGGPGAPVGQVTDYALLRAAELALAEGYPWFRVADRVTQSTGGGGGGPTFSIGGGSGGYGRRSSVGLGVGTSFNLGPGPALSTTLEVVFGKGPRPPGEAYDAQSVVNTIGKGMGRI
ncbi:CC0125/CC1285 family lipoprotein [Caulobacter hibisci]|uniref:DUF4136 domain-containing protein n=1 Tax=Caulobacter hibisci TaxID=2035993 RepID=A0ABS0SSQ8_9CAUL|nr:hypothetical protein [Caulobacter hibisci]MBI1682677.1 hypothetical protein [Caulobacter hibisci]